MPSAQRNHQQHTTRRHHVIHRLSSTRSPASKVNCRPAAPLPGDTPDAGVPVAGRIAYLEQCQARLGDRFTVYPLDMPPLVFLSDPAGYTSSSRRATRRPASGRRRELIAPLIGERSFMLLEEDEHIYGRRAITPAFHQQMVAEPDRRCSADIVEREVASWPLGHGLRAPSTDPRSDAEGDPEERSSARTDRVLEPLHERLMEMLSVTSQLYPAGAQASPPPGLAHDMEAVRQAARRRSTS